LGSITITNSPEYFSKIVKIDNELVKDHKQSLIKDEKNLYVVIDQTGIVYRASRILSDYIEFERIDSTYLFGYNGGAIVFSNNDTLFSLGGYGFWRSNGQLRYFNEIYHEWNIIKLNREVPITNLLYYHDFKNDMLYFLQFPYEDPATGKKQEKFILSKLDIKKRLVVDLGELNPELTKLFPLQHAYITVSVPSLNGLLVSFNHENQFFFDFHRNSTYRITNKNISDLFSGNSKSLTIANAFSFNDSIHFSLSNDTLQKIYSVSFSKRDLLAKPIFIYSIPYQANNNIIYFSILIIFLFTSFLIFKYKISPKSKKLIQIDDEKKYIGNETVENEFNSFELDLIKKLINNSKKGAHLNVDQINGFLGLTKKRLEVQKKIRTEMINKINHKFKIRFNVESVLIERVRSSEDRRFYEYFINKDNMEYFEGI
jgi:hypothetical protein